MSREVREVVADWMIVVSSIALFVSLFLVWSHQFSHAFVLRVGAEQLQGIPRNPSAWQVYSIADVLLALVAAALFVAALVGGHKARTAVLVVAVVALVFVIHALAAAPTSGANVADPSAGPGHYFPSSATSGAGELVAVFALGVSIAGLALSFTAD
jgi:hypothetical protein